MITSAGSKRQLRALRGEADERQDAAIPDQLERLLGDRRDAGGLDDVIRPAGRQLAHLLHDIAVGRVDGVGGAELLRELELVGHDVDRDDGPGSGDARALDGIQPHAAAAGDDHALARLHARRVEDGAESRRDAAADDRGELSGISGAILTVAFSCTSRCSANPDSWPY